MRGNQKTTQAIVLNRVNYGEADRILTLLTPHNGKLRLIAKGVRRIKSKNSGGIELFSVSSVTYIKGKSDIGTLVSSRLELHFGDIVQHIDRTMLAYECIKDLNTATEDECESVYFDLLEELFLSLSNVDIDTIIIKVWFLMQLLTLGGHTPNTSTTITGEQLQLAKTYSFNLDDMAFSEASGGKFSANHIKFMRLLLAHAPLSLMRVQGAVDYAGQLQPLIETMSRQYISK